jgi:hypothetical protein
VVLNPYEQGRRDGARGIERAVFPDETAHEQWVEHMRWHSPEPATTGSCQLDCPGLAGLPEYVRKQRRQLADGLANTRHLCPGCGASFKTLSKADTRREYESGYVAGSAQHAAGQQRRRNDQQRKLRRAKRRGLG